MTRPVASPALALPEPAAVLTLLKPITWFPPMWAFLCGAISSGAPLGARWSFVIAGIVLAGQLLCAASQAVNDWFDRHVDAVNEPQRPIPSGRVPGRWGLYIACFWSALSAAFAFALGPTVFAAALLGLASAWAYSAPPLRLKRNGWWGNAACGLCYEGLAWVTGAAVVIGGALPDARVLIVALLYSLGAHGIMTLNDFKAIEGDRRMGIGSLPVRLGPVLAARVACAVMVAPQCLIVALLCLWGTPYHAAAIAALILVQLALMVRLLRDPAAYAPWYNGTGVTLFVSGMMISAFALRATS